MGTGVTQNMAELGKQGGKKSGEFRRAKKEIEDVAQTILSMKINYPRTLKKMLQEIGVPSDKKVTAFAALYTVHFLKGLGGDLKSAYFCADVAGVTPRAKEHKAKIKMLDRMAQNSETIVPTVPQQMEEISLDEIRKQARELGVYEDGD